MSRVEAPIDHATPWDHVLVPALHLVSPMRRLSIAFMALAACGEPSEFDQLPEQRPTEPAEPEPDSTPEAPSVELCTLESLSLPSYAEVLQTGINPDDGKFWMQLGRPGETCDGSSSWGGWKLSIVFEQGRPVPGVYDLSEDPALTVSGSYSQGKTDGVASPMLPGGRLQVLDVDGEGIVEGVLCGVRFDRDDEFTPDAEPLDVEGQFTAGPC